MKPTQNPKLLFLQSMDMKAVPPSTRFAIAYNYSVRVQAFDDNNTQSIYYGEKFFKFRRDAEKWVEKMRNEHNRQSIISVFTLIRLEDNFVVDVFKTKLMTKHYHKYQKLMKMYHFKRRI